tara:strand:+ start:5638 stop:7641 length:2004 start_codon:yes stop_codon:yes gene_type:complete
MANSFVRYTGNGNTTQYAVSFSYRDQADISVTINGVATTAFSFNGAGTQITFDTAPANLSSIEIRRTTSQTSRLVDYAAGSVLTENDLDTDSNQGFFMSQEAIDDANDRIKLDNADFHWDAQSKRIKNIADPVDNTDVVNKSYISTNIPNITTVAGIASDVTTVAGISANVTAVAGDATDIGTVASNIASVNTVATNITKVVAVADDLAEAVSEVVTVADDLNEATSEIDTVATNIANVNTVGLAIANVNTVAGAITNVNNVGGSIANVNTVANNLSGVNSFAERYRVASSAPSSSTDVGDLYFDTTANELKVYKSSGWAAAGSTVNGTARRYTYNITGTPTTVTGADAKGDTLAYDAGFVDVFLNGVRQSNTSGSYTGDVTVSSGTSVVFASALAAGDVVDVVAYGTFSASNIAASDITSGTINLARIPSITNAKLDGSIANDKLANNSITINGSVVSLGGGVSVGETKPTATGCTPSTITNDATNVVIAGTNFVSIPQVWALNPSTGIWYQANSVSFTSATSITANFTLSVDAQYKIRVENPDGNATVSGTNILTVSDEPTWSTSAGSLGSIAGNFSGTVSTLSASSDSAITYSETTSVLTNASQANCSLNSSTGAITTSDFGGSSTTATTYNFTIRATDAEGQTTDRTFSLTSTFGASGGGQFN